MTSRKSQVASRRSKVKTFNSSSSLCGRLPSTCDLRLLTSRRAFTLIELVVTIVIMAIMALATMDYLVNAGRVYTLLLAQHQADSDAMAVVKRMRREARVLQANITTTSTEWAFSTPGYTNSFKWTGNAVLLNSNALAKNVQTFHLDYYNATNGAPTNATLIRRVALELQVTNNWVVSELKANFFLREGFLK